MFTKAHKAKYSYSKDQLEKVLGKTPDDLAESLEIMMVEVRPVGENREALRGAICKLRKEQTTVSQDRMLDVIRALKALWYSQHLEARVLICQRAIDLVGVPDAN